MMSNFLPTVAFEEHTRLKRARIDATSNIHAQFDAHRSSQQDLLVASAKTIETFTNKTLSRVSRRFTLKAVLILAY